jgi:hypothetical protein
MEKRSCERLSASIEVKFFCGNYLCAGKIIDLSEKGMCINSAICFPYHSKIDLFVPLQEKILEIPVKVIRVDKNRGFYDIMGLELLNPNQHYLSFVNDIKSSL